MSVSSFKHKDKRPHIPSKEEAGYEQSNPKVQEKQKADFPLNPVVHRGQDPELYWLNKYGNDNREELLKVDIRSLYRHEHISPEMLIKNLYRYTEANPDQLSLITEFNGMIKVEEAEKPGSYYKHQDDWKNRMILGDSLLTMTSLLEREGMAGKVQMVYMDPPYGINYNKNWQMKIGDPKVGSEAGDEGITGEPEMIKAYRDTWIDGIHTYLSYLRDRLLVARELLTPSGSCFVQISDQNVHLVRNLMDEVFGSENFVSLIKFRKKTMPLGTRYLEEICDFIILYARDKDQLKYRELFLDMDVEGDSHWNIYETPDGKRGKLTTDQVKNHSLLPKDADLIQLVSMSPIGFNPNRVFPINLNGKDYLPPRGKSWKCDPTGAERLKELNRIVPYEDGDTLRYVLKLSDYSITPLTSLWADTSAPTDMKYVVQTSPKVIQRCLLMSTDPGDLVLDPTCGSGTTAQVAEQWGRRWITIETSRIAITVAKQRLVAAVFPYYKLYDQQGQDVRQGFVYKQVQHITLESLTNQESLDIKKLLDRPEQDTKKLRVAGPFTVETLQSLNPLSPEELSQSHDADDNFEQKVFDHLKSAGVKTGVKQEQAVFTRVEPLTSPYLHAEGYYQAKKGERKAYIHIGPKFGTVSKAAVNEAIKECRTRGDADWLLVLGFSFESDVTSQNITTNFGSFEVSKIRMHDDLMQEGLLKKDKKAASFVTIAEPDVAIIHPPLTKGRAWVGSKTVQVEIRGLDIYDPIKDEVKPRDIHDIAYWMVDDDYDGSNFIVKQAFFCGSDSKDEFEDWKKGLSKLAVTSTRRRAEATLKIEIDEEAFERLYAHVSHPIEVKKKGQKIAMRVISQFGEESMKVVEV